VYLLQGKGSGLLTNGGSYVTLTNGSDFSMVIEKMAWAHSEWYVAWCACLCALMVWQHPAVHQ
jgi:hypothetical protein